jgi:hypothetical protein
MAMTYRIVALILFSLVATLHGAEPAGIAVDKEKKTVTIDAKVAPRKLPNLEQIYPIEVVACFAAPKGQKAHETVVTIEVTPSDVHKAIESLGLKPGKPADNQNDKPSEGPELMVYLEFEREGGGVKRTPVSQLLLDIKTGKALGKAVKFRFTGSDIVEKDPNRPGEKMYGADKSGTLIAVFPVTASCVLQSTMSFKDEKYVKLETDKKQLPKEGTAVKLIIEAGK